MSAEIRPFRFALPRLFAFFLLACGAVTWAQPGTPSGDTVLVDLGPGDSINVSVYGQPDMSGSLDIGQDGTVSVPLVGSIVVKGLSPADAARRIEDALRSGQILKDPHVAVTVTEARSQRVSILGDVGKPGRYSIETDTTLLDLIAQAGGITSSGGDVVYVIRTQPDGSTTRREIRLTGISDSRVVLAGEKPQPGDSFFVPKAEQFYIYGQVTAPNAYRLESGMTVVQAIARAGGVTATGSERRTEIKRKQPDGSLKTFKAKPSDQIQPDDVIRVKESIF